MTKKFTWWTAKFDKQGNQIGKALDAYSKEEIKKIAKELEEQLDENFRKIAATGLLTLGSLLAPTNTQAAPPTSITQNQNQPRLNAMKRVSEVHRFKKNWGSEFKQDQKLFDTILKLQTEKDHKDFIRLQEERKKEMFRVQMLGNHHPDKDIQKQEMRKVNNSYDIQLQDYIITLATASMMNL